jgi:hypothetical protein
MSAPPKYNILKQDGGESPFVSLDKAVVPPQGMPSGPGGGFAGGPEHRPAGGKRRKLKNTVRTFPRGILRKILPTSNPSQTRKRSVKLFSDKSIKAARMTAKKRVGSMKLKDIRNELIDKKLLPKNAKNVPPEMLRLLSRVGVGAGLIN